MATIILSGPQPPDPNQYRAPGGATEYDAYEASWSAHDSPDFEFRDLIHIRDTVDTIWRGGLVCGSFPPLTPFDRLNQAAAMVLENADNVEVFDFRAHNTGDGIKLKVGCDSCTIDGAHLSMVRDTAIQNDFGVATLVIKNCLIDGCFMFYDSRPVLEGLPDHSAFVTEIDNCLVRLRDMPTGFLGPGHGKFFSMDEAASFIDPKLKLTNNIFRVDTTDVCCGNFMMPTSTRVTTVSGNTMVWGGQGAWPYPTEAGWTVSTDKSVWDNAKAAWLLLPAHRKAALELPFPVDANRLSRRP